MSSNCVPMRPPGGLAVTAYSTARGFSVRFGVSRISRPPMLPSFSKSRMGGQPRPCLVPPHPRILLRCLGRRRAQRFRRHPDGRRLRRQPALEEAPRPPQRRAPQRSRHSRPQLARTRLRLAHSKRHPSTLLRGLIGAPPRRIVALVITAEPLRPWRMELGVRG